MMLKGPEDFDFPALDNSQEAGKDAPQKDFVNHPDHYGGGDNPYEVIKVIRAWDLDFWSGNAVKYIARAGRKDPTKHVEDLQKAIFYLEDTIKHLKETP